MREGEVVIVTGKMGSGKTDFSLFLVQFSKKTIITNIAMEEEYDNIIQTNTMSGVLNALVHAEKSIVVLDEASLFMNSKRIMSDENMALAKLVFMIRKFRSSMIFVAQRDMELAKTIRELSTLQIQKTSKKVARFYYPESAPLLFYNVPRTRIKFDTYNMAGFIVDIDIGKLFNHVSLLPFDKSRKELIRIAESDFSGFKLNEETEGDSRDSRKGEKRAVVERALKFNDDLSTEEIAELAGCSVQYVYRVKKEMRA